MNNQVRKQLQKIQEKIGELRSQLEEIKYDVESIKDEEEEKKDNIPENLQETDRYYDLENAVETLEYFLDKFDEADSTLEELEEDEAFEL